MSVARMTRVTVSCLIFLLFMSIPGFADIYRYRDQNGVWHFTNLRTDGRYRLYIRTGNKTPAQYIKAYKGIIRQASNRFGLSPSLIKAVIKAESDFDPRAVSSKGAQGLMQLMPGTADQMEVQDPFNPEENIFGGARYLSMLLRRFKNNTVLAVAAYNAGPEQVVTHGGVPPFPETRTFVKRVMNYYREYNAGTR